MFGDSPICDRTHFLRLAVESCWVSAGDFANSGYRAEDLSSNWFWRDADKITEGEADFDECCAFFTASELRSAAYDASELRHACFSIQDLKEAGFGLPELTEARYNEQEAGYNKFTATSTDDSERILVVVCAARAGEII